MMREVEVSIQTSQPPGYLAEWPGVMEVGGNAKLNGKEH